MAKTKPQTPDKGKSKPDSSTQVKPASPRVISCQVFNDFAAI